MNRKDLRALTLVGPTRENPVPDPLGVLHLEAIYEAQDQLRSVHGLRHCYTLMGFDPRQC